MQLASEANWESKSVARNIVFVVEAAVFGLLKAAGSCCTVLDSRPLSVAQRNFFKIVEEGADNLLLIAVARE